MYIESAWQPSIIGLNETMKTITVHRSFPQSVAVLIHQTGAQLSEPKKGVEIVLHRRAKETEPCCAELISGELHAEIGLWFNGRELVDYDGAFSLPREVAAMIKDAGYVVSEERFE